MTLLQIKQSIKGLLTDGEGQKDPIYKSEKM